MSIEGLEGERQWWCITSGSTLPAITHQADAHVALGASISQHESTAWAVAMHYLLKTGVTVVQMPFQAVHNQATT